MPKRRSIYKIALFALAFALLYSCLEAKDAPGLRARVVDASSSRVQIQWSASFAPRAISVRLSPEPFTTTRKPKPPQVLYTARKAGSMLYLDNLAPAADVFIRMEIAGDDKLYVADLHARTLGGPRAALDNPVREAHLYAPDVLGVTLANGDGKAWEEGTWKVRRQDAVTPISVKRAYRRSVPVGAPVYEVGWGKPYDNARLDVDHTIFLVLAEPVGSLEILYVEGPEGVRFILPVSDRYLETPVIQLNQVGYNPRAARRYAYVYGHLGDGGPLDLSAFPEEANILVESKNPLKPRPFAFNAIPLQTASSFDADAGGPVKQIDLSIIPPSPDLRFRIQIPGVGVSWPTAVSEEAFFRTFYVAARGLFHNRWGGDLASDYTEWSRPSDHPFVYTGELVDFSQKYPADTPKVGKRPLVGGYHDAGDFDQRPPHIIVAMLLMSAFEYEMTRFTDGQFTIPESGNGIPDLLDEALWGVAAWEQLQEEDGGVRLGVESSQHPGGYQLASDDPLSYWTYARHQTITAHAAALFAQASRLVRTYDPARADKLLERAEKAYAYARERQAPSAYMLYAAGEMLLLTGDSSYKNDFERAWESMGAYGAFNKFAANQAGFSSFHSALHAPQQAFAMVDYLMGYLASPYASPTIKANSRKWLIEMAQRLTETTFRAHAHKNPRPDGGHMGWGQGATMGRYLDVGMALLRLGDLPAGLRQDLFDAMSLAVDYMLGANPLGMVYYTGLGARRVQEPLHLDSLVFVKQGKGPVPGIPIFGPIDGEMRAPWAEATFAAFYPRVNDLPHALRYGDVRTLVFCNESTVWENYAPNVKLLAFMIGDGQMPPERWLPGQPGHKDPLP